jgi:hypothetical protein
MWATGGLNKRYSLFSWQMIEKDKKKKLQEMLKRLGFIEKEFSGSVELNFHKGSLSRKIKKTDTIEIE